MGVSKEFKSAMVFELIEDGLKMDEGENLIPKIKGIFCFTITSGPGGATETWIVDAKNGHGSVTKGGKAKADVTITIADKDFMSLMGGELNPQKAFFQGKLKIKGNLGMAMKMQVFQKQIEIKSKL